MARNSKLETEFEKDFIEELDKRLPGGMIIKGNSAFRQGIPDRIFLHGPHWAMLEFKRDEKSPHQPNQPWYVEKLNGMSYAAVVTPSNYHEVLDDLQEAFRAEG